MPVSRQRRRRGRAASRGSGSADSLSLTRPRRKKTNKLYLIAAVTIAVLVIGSFGLTSIPFGSGGGGSSAAQIGDHWHASLLLEICGEGITLPESSGGVHSHGDGLIHIHPHSADEAGRNATLGRFFDSLDMVMDSDRVRPPSGQLYVNGDTCADGSSGLVQVLVNGEDQSETFRTYTPRDGDRVEVKFQ